MMVKKLDSRAGVEIACFRGRRAVGLQFLKVSGDSFSSGSVKTMNAKFAFFAAVNIFRHRSFAI